MSFDGLTGEVKLAQGRVAAERDPAGRSTASCGRRQSGHLPPFKQLLTWCRQDRAHGRAHQRRSARSGGASRYAFGARGIGLCRTEHMFFGEGPHPDRAADDSRRDTEADRQAALAELLPFQREDFYGVFKAMNG